MCDELDEYIKTIISKVASACKLSNYEYVLNKFDSIGQNYFGVLIPLILQGISGDKQVKLHIVLKLAPTDERYRVSGALTLFFNREIFIYSILFKAYDSLQTHLDSFSRYIAPACYYVCKEYCKEVLAIEDMRAQGFQLYTDSFLDYNHTSISMVTLGRFHALSFLLRLKEYKLYEEVVKNCVPLNIQTNKRFMQILEDRLDKALQYFSNTKYMDFLQDLRKRYVKYIEDMYDSVKGVALCHGDIWKENILFNYKVIKYNLY